MINKKAILKQQSIIPEENESQYLSPIHRNEDNVEKSFVVQSLIDSIEKISVTPVQIKNTNFINIELEKKIAQYENQLQFDKFMKNISIKNSPSPPKQQNNQSQMSSPSKHYSSNRSSFHNNSVDSTDISVKQKKSNLTISPLRKNSIQIENLELFIRKNSADSSQIKIKRTNTIKLNELSKISQKLLQEKQKFCRCAPQYKLIEKQERKISQDSQQLERRREKNKLINKLENIRRSQKQERVNYSQLIQSLQQIQGDYENQLETNQPPQIYKNSIQYKLQNELNQLYQNYLDSQILNQNYEIQESCSQNNKCNKQLQILEHDYKEELKPISTKQYLKKNSKQQQQIKSKFISKQKYLSKQQQEQKEIEEMEQKKIEQQSKLQQVYEWTKKFDAEQEHFKNDYLQKFQKFTNISKSSIQNQDPDLNQHLEKLMMKLEILQQDTIKSINV